MLDEYVRMADADHRFQPAWLTTMGQCDCKLEIALIEAQLAKLGFPVENGIESH